jgi:hypothetical protein
MKSSETKTAAMTSTCNRTGITISKPVKERLDKIGCINQSYSQLVEQLADYNVASQQPNKEEAVKIKK